MRYSSAHLCVLLTLCVVSAVHSLFAAVTSPELERLQLEIAPYVLPDEVGSKIIPAVSFENATLDSVSQTMEAYGVTIVAAESLQNAKVNLALRNLSVNRILQFITHQINAQWFYLDGRVIIFRSADDLNPTFQGILNRKVELDRKIRAETKRLWAIESEVQKVALSKVFITEFFVDEKTTPEILENLSEATISTNYNDGRGVNIIPLFDPKLYKEKRSYNFRNKSIAEILDTVCSDFNMQWRVGESAITVSPKK